MAKRPNKSDRTLSFLQDQEFEEAAALMEWEPVKLNDPESDNLSLLEIIVALVLGALIGSLARNASGDDYLAARVAAAVSLARKSHAETKPAPPSVSTLKQDDLRPVVYLYSAPFKCPPCEQAKADIKAWRDSPMRFVTDRKAPFAVESYPTLHWNDANGKGLVVVGWPGVKSFEAAWLASQKRADAGKGSDRLGSLSPQGANRWPAMAGYQAQWTWPGDLREHLLTTHGVGEAPQLTQDQAEALHDALHEGYSLDAIRRRLSR